MTDPLIYTTTYTYDGNRNLVTSKDPNGHTITNTYDLADELTRVTYPDGTHEDRNYDGNGNLSTQTDALGQTTRYGYDSFNRLISSTDPLTRTTSYGYDLVGNRLVLTDALALTTTYGYDNDDRLTAITYHGVLTTPNVSFAYNPLGLRTVMTDGTGTSLYSYDSLDRLTAVQNGAGQTVGYGYDLADNLSALTYPNGKQVSYSWNAGNELVSLTDWLTQTTTFAYNHEDSLTKVNYANGAQATLTYDNDAVVKTISDTNGSTVFLNLAYTRDKREQVTGLSDAAAGSDSYSYDPLNRLLNDTLSATTPVTRTWGYDAATQIYTATTTTGAGAPVLSSRQYDAAGELLSLVNTQSGVTTTNRSLGYNARGDRITMTNTLLSTVTTLTYDQAGRLTHIGPTWAYAYNGDGQRASKTIGATTTSYVWDGGLLLADSTASYIYGPGGMLIEQVAGNTPYYYHSDQLGSIRALTDARGTVTNTYTYDAYGNRTGSTGTVANPFGYAGAYTDAETTFLYLQARYYDPSTQQFLTRDPLVAVTEQGYTYAGGSSTNATDPLGLSVGPISQEHEDSRPPAPPIDPWAGQFHMPGCPPSIGLNPCPQSYWVLMHRQTSRRKPQWPSSQREKYARS